MRKITPITSFAELAEAKKRIDRIDDEIMDLEDEIGDLRYEADRLEEEIARFGKTQKVTEESTASKLWKHVQECWYRFTWAERRIAERAASGDELDWQEKSRFKLLCMQELHIVELSQGGAK